MLKNEIKNFSKEDFENNKVNLHIHTTFSDGILLDKPKKKAIKK